MEKLSSEELREIAENAYLAICEFHEKCEDGNATADDEKKYESDTRTYQSAMFWLFNK